MNVVRGERPRRRCRVRGRARQSRRCVCRARSLHDRSAAHDRRCDPWSLTQMARARDGSAARGPTGAVFARLLRARPTPRTGWSRACGPPAGEGGEDDVDGIRHVPYLGRDEAGTEGLVGLLCQRAATARRRGARGQRRGAARRRASVDPAKGGMARLALPFQGSWCTTSVAAHAMPSRRRLPGEQAIAVSRRARLAKRRWIDEGRPRLVHLDCSGCVSTAAPSTGRCRGPGFNSRRRRGGRAERARSARGTGPRPFDQSSVERLAAVGVLAAAPCRALPATDAWPRAAGSGRARCWASSNAQRAAALDRPNSRARAGGGAAREHCEAKALRISVRVAMSYAGCRRARERTAACASARGARRRRWRRPLQRQSA